VTAAAFSLAMISGGSPPAAKTAARQDQAGQASTGDGAGDRVGHRRCHYEAVSMFGQRELKNQLTSSRSIHEPFS
jgi:hypothetical protein